jgi:hypothetical protein
MARVLRVTVAVFLLQLGRLCRAKGRALLVSL